MSTLSVVLLVVALVSVSANVLLAVILWRKSRTKRVVNRISRRVSKLPSEALPQWAEQVLGETGRSFSSWRTRGEHGFISDAATGAEALTEVLREIRDRQA